MRTPDAVPDVVPVADLDAAESYYRDVLGFAVERTGDAAAVARPPGEPDAAVELREPAAGDEAPAAAEAAGGSTVVLPVRRPHLLYRRLGDRGARVVTPAQLGGDRDDRFGVVDCCGNTLVLAPAPGLLPAIRRLPEAPGLRRLSAALDERRAAREEAPHLAAFRAFHDGLADRRDVLYMFFSGGLLHWAAKAASYVPAGVNLVLVGSALSAEEQDWVRTFLGRPFHHIELRIDDQTMWEFLVAVCDRNFGWLDIDCLVLNDGLFAELAAVAADDLLNCTWSQSRGDGWVAAGTPFVFLNIEAVRAVRASTPQVSPRAYRWIRASREVPGRRCYTLTPGRRLCRRLLTVLDADERGRPRMPGGAPYLDTTVVFQLVARTLGYGVRQVRPLARAGQDGPGTGDEYSDELIHVGGVSYAGPLTDFSRLFHSLATRQRLLIADYVALHDAPVGLPPAYQDRRRLVVEELAAGGMPAGSIVPALRDFLRHDRGLSEAAVAAVLGEPDPRPDPGPEPGSDRGDA